VADTAHTRWLDAAALSRLMAQPLFARLPMEGNISGQHKSPHRGSSVEFAEYRNYVPGDDIRRLDWRVFGRTDRFYLKEFEAETNLRCYIVLDCSASMAFVAEHGVRFDFARRLAAALAYLTIHQGDAAGLLTVGSKIVTEIPPKRNPAHLQLMLETIDEAKTEGETALAAGLHELAERVRSRALVVIISDFFCDATELLNALQHLRFKKHDLALFQLLDPVELAFNFDRPIRFVDLESEVSLVTEPGLVRDRYQKLIREHLALIKAGCHEFNADYREVLLNENYEKVIADFLIGRARLAAMSR
jgi:uncharacterized protein (DUF58 family)